MLSEVCEYKTVQQLQHELSLENDRQGNIITTYIVTFSGASGLVSEIPSNSACGHVACSLG